MSPALALALLAALAGCSVSQPPASPPQTRTTPPPELMKWPALLGRPRPEPDSTLAYGEDQMQKVDLWLPAGRGPHPTVLMVHGGCWQTEIADRRIMNWIADDLRKRGIAVWNIDYRGVDRGGGYPGTFADAAAAADALRTHARRYRLDVSPLVAVGHSAGGHLALWLAARRSAAARASNPLVPRGSPLLSADPLRIDAVVSLGGLPDLELAATPPGSGCGTEVIEKLVGPPTLSSRNVYADTSVPRLAPLGIRQVLINGLQDRIIPTAYAEDYAARMRAAGDKVKVRMIDRTGHVELIAPETEAWAATVEEIEAALGRKR
ncbi:MAG TPA: alpha/beta hydrolase [Allosphingosinicella sp.]|jgi:acetyl esterase/lipase|nr:alpha/beta hydrolase [Allosphingosinicella sp.]